MDAEEKQLLLEKFWPPQKQCLSQKQAQAISLSHLTTNSNCFWNGVDGELWCQDAAGVARCVQYEWPL